MSASAPFPQIGLLYRQADIGMPIDELAHAAVERSFDAIVAAEHTHIPSSRATPFAGGGELPEVYTRLLDPYVALAFIAAQTNLNIGTCVALVAQHDPIALAKTVATLDHMSKGRFSLGVGFGWNREELTNHGHEFKHRRARARESVELMRALWRDTHAEFHGDHVDLEPSWAWPKPAQPMPVLLGCAPTARGFAEVVGWTDGWIPGGYNADMLEGWLTTLRQQWLDAGRDETGPIIWAMQNVVDDEQLRSQLDRFQAMGVTQVLFDIPTVSSDEILPILDRYAAVIAAIRG